MLTGESGSIRRERACSSSRLLSWRRVQQEQAPCTGVDPSPTQCAVQPSPSKSGELRGVPETGRGSSAGGEADGKACLKLTGSQKLASLEWAQEKGSEIQLSPGI